MGAISLPLRPTDRVFSLKDILTGEVGFATLADFHNSNPTIYTADGSITPATGFRTVDLNGNVLAFSSPGNIIMTLDPRPAGPQVFSLTVGDEATFAPGSFFQLFPDSYSLSSDTATGEHADMVWSISPGDSHLFIRMTGNGGAQTFSQAVRCNAGAGQNFYKIIMPNTQFSIVDDRKGYNFTNIQQFANNAAALVGGLVAGDLYRITGTDNLAIVH